MLLDVFKGDAFGWTHLTTTVSKVPYQPTRIGKLGWFTEKPVNTLSVAVEMENGVLTLVQSKPRGAPGAPKTLQRRNIRDFRTVHLPQTVSMLADEIQGLRAFGSMTETETAMARIAQKMAIPRRDLDLTHEYQRLGCVKGVVLDADGSTIYNWFTEFGVSQQTQAFALSTDGTKVLQVVLAAKRKSEDRLGGVMNTGWRSLCSPEFFDAFTSHPAVVESYARYQQGAINRSDNRSGFEFGDVIWEEYRGSIGGTPMIAANKAYMVPEGVPDFFETFFSPADWMETVNTDGVPFYAKQEMMPFGRGIDIEVQSNPLHMCTRPEAIIELTAS